MKYLIEWSEVVQTATGKEYKKVNIVGISSVVSCWPDFSQYDAVKPEAEVEAIIRTSGKYKNLVDEDKKPPVRTNVIKEAQQRKEHSIALSQEKKESSIKLAASARDATLIVVNFYPELAEISTTKDNKIKDKWEYWRRWLADKMDEPF